ncbi:hypothetical protein AtNW77_Chr2g0259521 [Arabidopsis thaliana]
MCMENEKDMGVGEVMMRRRIWRAEDGLSNGDQISDLVPFCSLHLTPPFFCGLSIFFISFSFIDFIFNSTFLILCQPFLLMIPCA